MGASDDASPSCRRASARRRLAMASLQTAVSAGDSARRSRCGYRRPLVSEIGWRGGTVGAPTGVLAMDGIERRCSCGVDYGLAYCPVVAPRVVTGGDSPLPAQWCVGAERLGRVFPHGADGLESAHSQPAARSNLSGDAGGHATPARTAGKGRGDSGSNQQRSVAFPAPRRDGVSTAGLVRDQPAAEAAGDNHDRWRVQYPSRLAARRERR